ncbi:MAG: hypothetical protein ACOYMA_02255 [Bacteroidia bacterium]
MPKKNTFVILSETVASKNKGKFRRRETFVTVRNTNKIKFRRNDPMVATSETGGNNDK